MEGQVARQSSSLTCHPVRQAHQDSVDKALPGAHCRLLPGARVLREKRPRDGKGYAGLIAVCLPLTTVCIVRMKFFHKKMFRKCNPSVFRLEMRRTALSNTPSPQQQSH